MQQPPYQPYQPVPPLPPYAPMPVTPLKKPKRSRWFLGCGLLVVMLAVCGLCAIITNTSSHQTDTSTDTSNADPTPTATGSHMVVSMTIHSPTAVIAHPTNVRPTDTPKPTQPPVPTIAPSEPTQSAVHTGVNGNPWGYDFTPGTYITSPPVDFCSVFDCIKNFPKGIGYVVECNDGMYSKSGGRPGNCSHNGGEAQILYAH